MSYSVIFKTKIVKLSDGRILYFNRSGCNNDTAGRHPDDWTVEIYTEQTFNKYVETFKRNSKPYKTSREFDLKIYGKTASYYDYGAHLERMKKRAISYKKFIAENQVCIKLYDGIKFTFLDLTNENSFVNAIENHLELLIYIA